MSKYVLHHFQVPLYADLRCAALTEITGCMYDSTRSVYHGHTIHVKYVSGCQQPTSLLTVGYLPSILPRTESLIQLLSLQPLLKPA